MEINEKLDTFFHAAIEAANEQSAQILGEQKAACDESLAEYERQKQKEQQTRLRIAEEKVRKNVNRTLSEQVLALKKEYHREKEREKEALFALVEEKLAAFRSTEGYQDYLVKKIMAAKDFAGGEDLTVYLDPFDGGWKESLEQKTGCTLTVSREEFSGGIRAVIRSKNVLIDDSFARKISEEKEGF